MILVTGGAGLLGGALIAALLDRGQHVRAIYNHTALPAFPSNNLEQVQCDILDVVQLEAVMQGVKEVYHCAGLVSFHSRDEARLYKINVEGTANVIDAALDAGVRKVLHVSSVAALGRIRINEVITEKMQWTPETSNSRYGESKYLGEMEVWRGIAEGLNAVIINPTIILGPGNWDEGSTAIFKSAYNEFPWYTSGSTGFVDVRDVAEAAIQLMSSNISGEKYIVSAHNQTYQQVFNAIADAFGKKRPHKKVTPFLAGLVSMMESIKSKFTGKDPLVTKETAATAMATVAFDNSKLLQHLPSFKYRPIQDTIEYSCSVLQQKLNKH
ncbi:MAG: NAD-dependent epimerase/dehydratase family protein [Chitinophagaceae bacterium]|nr:MAG: NAD-dependent epimerase/dehydratase family protein [Chitinophagaceae bacterium]